MTNNLCPPCVTKEVIEEPTSTIKWVKYKKSKDNSGDIIDTLKNKNCVADLFDSYSNKDPSNPTDAFNKTAYDAKVEQLLSIEKMQAPDV